MGVSKTSSKKDSHSVGNEIIINSNNKANTIIDTANNSNSVVDNVISTVSRREKITLYVKN